MENSKQEATNVTHVSSFKNQAILSQGIKNGIMQHYFQTHGGEEAAKLPPYLAEAITLISFNLSGIANNDPMDEKYWKEIKKYADTVIDCLGERTDGKTT